LRTMKANYTVKVRKLNKIGNGVTVAKMSG